MGSFYIPEGQRAKVIVPQKYRDYFGEVIEIKDTIEGFEVLFGAINQRIDPRLMTEDWIF